MNDKVAFEKNWEKFLDRYKGKMISQSKVRKITYDVAKLTLLDTLSAWGSEYEECGRWLRIYCDRYPNSGDRICHILEGITLKEAEKPKGLKKEIAIAAPLVIAAIVALMGIVFKWGWIVTPIVAILSAAVTGSVVKTVSDSIKAQKERDIIGFYTEQINKYKSSILELIER